MKIHFHEGDLPGGLDFGRVAAIDSETLGLNPLRDGLCLAQISAGDGHCHILRFDRKTYHAPHFVRLLQDPETIKLFHYARFDVGVFRHYLKTDTSPVWCTKIASRLVRTYTDRHGLKDLVKEVLDLDLSKQQQSSDWGAAKLSDAQLAYAASDVLHLHKVKNTLEAMLVREGRLELAKACFGFIGTRTELDLGGWSAEDIFAH
ncbi:MAG TPA: ribonuclease D [Alphaproteobacteria bacterium]|nr:ribonuclease D [Alphaproteobacteria bacterium]HAJ45895.1 ribonuclease D [Alphaproteobacteria bacterium]